MELITITLLKLWTVKKIEVLTEAGGAMIATTAHYYKSPALAKEYASNDYYADHHGDD